MPKIRSPLPDALQPYRDLGIVQDCPKGETQVYLDCPFCGREDGKFSINTETGVWRCFVCAEGNERGGGNIYVFIGRWLSQCLESTDYSELLEDREGIDEETLLRWNVAYNPLTGDWMIPGYNHEGRLSNLYRYRIGRGCWGLKKIKHQLFGVDKFKGDSEVVYVVEGPWDAMAVYQVLEPGESVLGIPGCKVFNSAWAKSELFQDREIVFLLDNDYPKKNPKTGKTNLPAGNEGMKFGIGVLTEAGIGKGNLNYLKWGKKGYDPDLPDGFDVRDALNSHFKGSRTPREAFEKLIGRISHPPEEWLREEKKSSGENSELSVIPCDNYKTVVEAWEKAMHWTDGLDKALSCMLSSVLTTKLVGEQLWFKIISPPASGKTTLLEGISVCRKHVISKDTIRGFYTGWASGEDTSIAAMAADRTLAIKDGDTLLKSPNLAQILSEGRGLYDGAGRTHYRNNVMRDYEGHRMTWLLCGTSALREIDDSELGARFLDCVIMDGIDEKFERQVGIRAADQEIQNMLVQCNGRPENRSNPDLITAMRLTGGYVKYLRENDVELVSSVQIDSELGEKCNQLGLFISKMRARPSKFQQDEEAGREFSPRLVKQLTRLTIALTAVMNKSRPDREVLNRVNQIARDTARGITLDICKMIHEEEDKGMSTNAIHLRTGLSDGRVGKLCRFMKSLKILYYPKVGNNQRRWKLTGSMRKLYEQVMD